MRKNELRTKLSSINEANFNSKSFCLSQMDPGLEGYQISLVSSKYRNVFYISSELPVDGMIEGIAKIIQENNISEDEFFIEFDSVLGRQISEENQQKILMFIEKLKDSIPILINGVKLNEEFYKLNKIFFGYNEQTNLNVIYESVLNNNLFLGKSDFPVIIIDSFDISSCQKIKMIIEYVDEFYPETKLRFRLNISSKKDLLNLENFLPIIEDKETKIILDGNLFIQEELNDKSARSIIRNDPKSNDIVVQKNQMLIIFIII